MRSALILGIDSAIGAALGERLAAEGVEITGTTRREYSSPLRGGVCRLLSLDLAADPAAWPALPQADAAFICAAVSKLDACEQAPEAARRVNVTGTVTAASRLNETGIFTLFFSSNHVFDGTKPHRRAGDPTAPINEYGRQKAGTEKALLALPQAAVLRLTKVVMPGDARIMAWANALREGKEVTAFDNIFLAPVTLDNLLDAMIGIANARKPGMYQISGPEDFSYFDLARAIARHLGLPESLVKHGSADNAQVPPSFRPRYSSYAQALPEPIAVPDMEGIVAYALEV